MKKDKPIKEQAQYDPQISYQWSPTDVFDITGMEFEYMYKFLSDYLTTPESIKVIRAYETHKILEQKLKEGVESGKIVPSEK